MDAAELKRKIRQLKNLEMRLRYGEQYENPMKSRDKKHHSKPHLLWDEFFDLNERGRKKARYTMDQLLHMDKAEYRSMINEFFFQVYYRIYQDRGLSEVSLYDPELLQQLGLPYDADGNAVKKRFRELAKEYHPDTGGDSGEFIRLMELYEEIRQTEQMSKNNRK